MSNEMQNEKIIQLMLDNLYPISNSISIILDNLVKLSNNEVPEGRVKEITDTVLGEVKKTIPLIEHLNEEVPNYEYNENDLEILSRYHSALDSILEGFQLILTWITKERDPDVLEDAINELFNGAKKTINLVNDIL